MSELTAGHAGVLVDGPSATDGSSDHPVLRARRRRDVRPFRADIQALRALAVTAVLLNHFWPRFLPGGFVGVDVFFVISGFLITGHLVAHPPRDLVSVGAFWARRIRRLLPAALLVLVVATSMAWLVASPRASIETAEQARAAATYWVNWLLASSSVDYFAQNAQPSAIQHYWSLSVEEQFYFVWPLVLLAVYVPWRRRVGGGAGRARPERALAATLGVLFVASLAASAYQTAASPASAYFVTHTRLWEFALGALLAVSAVRLPSWSSWLGFFAVAASCLWFTGSTPFPSVTALLPTLGTAMVIAARPQARLLAFRPIQWLGDVSYGVYLWHWPLMLLLPHVIDRFVPTASSVLGRWEKPLILLVGLAAAQATKVLIEDPCRYRRPGARLRWVFLAAAAGIGVVVALTAVQVASGRHAVDQRAAAIEAEQQDACFGAGALADPVACAGSLRTPWVVDLPVFYNGVDDASSIRATECFSPAETMVLVRCDFGDVDSSSVVVLTGNSHALQWLPAMKETAERRGWHLVMYTVASCMFGSPDPDVAGAPCRGWQESAMQAIEDLRPSLVVTSNFANAPEVGLGGLETVTPERLVASFERAFGRLSEARIPVVVLRDAPYAQMAEEDAALVQCPDVAGIPLHQCGIPRGPFEYDDPAVRAARALGSATVTSVDLNDFICEADFCAAFVGGVQVRADIGHLNGVYAASLSPYLESALARTGLAPG